MKVSYSDFVKLCRVEDTENWCGWLSVRADGVYVKIPPDGLTYEEKAALSEHPTGKLADPALCFPCDLSELQKFLEHSGLYGCIDAFDLAKWVLDQHATETRSTTTRDHVSDKLAKVNQASQRFWGNASREDRGTHSNNAIVAKWLVEQGLSQALASKAASIIRPEWAPSGRKPQE